MRKPDLTTEALLSNIDCKNWTEVYKIVSEFSGVDGPGGEGMVAVAQDCLEKHSHPSDSVHNDPIKFYQMNYYCRLMEYTPNCTCGGGDTCSSCHWWLTTAPTRVRMIALVQTIRKIKEDKDT